jgi:hypothetical protein
MRLTTIKSSYKDIEDTSPFAYRIKSILPKASKKLINKYAHQHKLILNFIENAFPEYVSNFGAGSKCISVVQEDEKEFEVGFNPCTLDEVVDFLENMESPDTVTFKVYLFLQNYSYRDRAILCVIILKELEQAFIQTDMLAQKAVEKLISHVGMLNSISNIKAINLLEKRTTNPTAILYLKIARNKVKSDMPDFLKMFLQEMDRRA